MVATDLIKLLAQRHADDLFVPECKDGPTLRGEHCRLDAWAMRKSWSRPIVWGYEVKVSRRDFVQDTKWQAYLPYCNEFYFVTTKDIVREGELAENVGLLVVAGSRLVCKKKAVYREVEVPESMWRYILMNRVRIIASCGLIEPANNDQQKRDRVERNRQWAEDKSNRTILASLIGSKLQARLEELERRNSRLNQYRKATKLLERRLREIGIDPENPEWLAEHKIREFADKLSGDFKWVDGACTEVERAIAQLRKSVAKKVDALPAAVA